MWRSVSCMLFQNWYNLREVEEQSQCYILKGGNCLMGQIRKSAANYLNE